MQPTFLRRLVRLEEAVKGVSRRPRKMMGTKISRMERL